MLAEITEVAAHASRFQQFWGTFWDFGHFTTEIAVTVLFDGIVGAVLWPLTKRAVRIHDRTTHPVRLQVEADDNERVQV